MDKLNPQLRALLATLMLIAILAFSSLACVNGGGDNTSSWKFEATYQTQTGQQYTMTGTGTGVNKMCPPFQNGGKDRLVSCKTD